MIDAHCHLQEFEDPTGVITNLEAVICCGGGVSSSQKAVEIALKNSHIYATVGIHPEDWQEFIELGEEHSRKTLLELSKNSKVVAIGECGLDYYDQTTETDKQNQQLLLKFNIDLAKQTKMPLVVHCRNAFDDAFKLIDYASVQMHCFTGNLAQVEECLRRGWYISFGGILTFKSSHGLREVAKIVPTDKLLIETDAPYLAPEPNRGSRNTPQNVKIVAETLAQVRGVTVAEIDRITSENARQLFKLHVEEKTA